jgi:hypothetical protein
MADNWLNKKELATVFEEGHVTPPNMNRPMSSSPEVLHQLLARAEFLRAQTAMFGPSPGWQQDGSFIPPIVASCMKEEGGQIGNHFMKINTEALNHIWLVGHFPHHNFPIIKTTTSTTTTTASAQTTCDSKYKHRIRQVRGGYVAKRSN